MKTAIIALMASSVLFTGCAIKKTDTSAEKVGKHIINSPLYALSAINTATIIALSPIIVPVGLAAKAIKGTDSNATDINASDKNITIADINSTTTGENDENNSSKDNNIYLDINSTSDELERNNEEE